MAPFSLSSKPPGIDPAALDRYRAWLKSFARHDPPAPLAIPFGAPRGPVSLVPPFRPAPTPTAAGLTPGFEHLVTDARRGKRRRFPSEQVARLVRDNAALRAALDRLSASVERLETAAPDTHTGRR